MKRFCSVIMLCLLISGCADPSVYKQRDILVSRAPSNYALRGSSIPVNMADIRGQLVSNGWETDDFIKRLTTKCYQLSYLQSGSCALDFYYGELVKRKSEQSDALCDKNEKCVEERNIYNATRNLNSTYYVVMARNPYDQSEFDLNLRSLCRAAGVAQRRGITLSQIESDIGQQPGLSPEVRGQFKGVAEACWILSENGVADGTTKIKNLY